MNRILFSGFVITFFGVTQALAAVIEIYPGDSFKNAAENLNAGDTLIVHAGEYTHSSRIGISVHGTAQNPVMIRGADGEARPRIRLTSSGHNTIDISGATYLTIRGLEITSPGIDGADGINLKGEPSYITIENNVIHDISVGINLRSTMQHIVVRRNEIFDTNDTGEGMYIGCHEGDCTVSNSIFEQNYIHHTNSADQGDGIEIKKNSHSNIIRDNVIHDTFYPCIILYGTGGNNQNIVERNIVWNCADSGIQVAADAVIRNNIIFGGDGNTINSQPHAGVSPDNLQFIHNTIIGGSTCLRMNDWGNKSAMVFANNAVYCSGSNFSIDSLSGVTVSGNVFETAPPVIPPSGYTLGRTRNQDFINSALHDAYPSNDSPLIGAANNVFAVTDDFNGTQRSGAVDAGAYDWTGPSNPGWRVTEDFKDAALAPTVDISAEDTDIDTQGTTTLHWTSSNADTCVAGADWAGPKGLTGSQLVGPLVDDATFMLTCVTNSGVQTSVSVDVRVRDPNETPEPDTAPLQDPANGGSSGSAVGYFSLLLLLACRIRRRTKQR